MSVMSTIDQQFVEFVVKSLVGNPEAVSIERSIDDKGVLLQLTVDPEDLGRIIGKRGATAQSLRTLLRALGTKNEERYNLKIVDNGPNDNYQSSAPAAASSTPKDDDDESAAESAQTSTPAQDDEEEYTPSATVSKTRKELEDLDDLDI